MDDLKELYKPNSQKSKTPVQEKEIKQITSKPAKVRKKTKSKKFMESFFAEDVTNIKDYILYDVILPALKNTIVDAATNCVQMIFWGDTKRPSQNTLRNGGKTYVSYGNYSNSSINNKNTISNISRATHSFDDIILESRGEAEEVLSQLVDLTIDYGSASVSDLYYMVGIQSSHTDQKWGWTDLSSAYVARVRDGYIIKLPKTIVI